MTPTQAALMLLLFIIGLAMLVAVAEIVRLWRKMRTDQLEEDKSLLARLEKNRGKE